MNVLILGMDGYIGWGLSLHLAEKGINVTGVDNFSRRKHVDEIGSWSAIPISTMKDRLNFADEMYPGKISFFEGDILHYDFLASVLKKKPPDSIVHLAEMPSAPFSMIDARHAFYTQENNVLGTLNLLFAMRDNSPDAHLIKLGTMGEYGTPPLDIPEGFFDVEYRGRKANVMFPRQPGSFYHASKVHDTHNIMLACRIWGLRSTDIMQGVLFGTRTHEINPSERVESSTRFDFDEVFGTVINRYCAQAVVGYPLSIYGKGGQTRGFLSLVDSLQCLTLACENPPERGEYRVFNQLENVYDVTYLAKTVEKAAARNGISVTINHSPNPRKEAEEHYYKVDAHRLPNLGFKPTRPLDKEVEIMLEDLIKFKDRIKEKEHVIAPRTTWDGKGLPVAISQKTTTQQK
jgi:UDP-sulfoquinovose synthase